MSAILFWNHVLMEGVFCCSSCCVKVNATQIAASALPSCSEQRNNGGLSFSQGLISVFLQTEWLWLFMNEFKFVCLYSDLFRQRRRPVPKGLSLFCLYSLISLSGPSNGGPLPSLLVTWFGGLPNISIPIRANHNAAVGGGSELVKRRRLLPRVLDKQISRLVILEWMPQSMLGPVGSV